MYGRTVHVVRPTDRVRAVMMWPVATVETVATLSEVAEALAADEVGALCVVENDALAGIVSERDVVTHLAAGGDPAHLTAGVVNAVHVIRQLELLERPLNAQIARQPVHHRVNATKCMEGDHGRDSNLLVPMGIEQLAGAAARRPAVAERRHG